MIPKSTISTQQNFMTKILKKIWYNLAEESRASRYASLTFGFLGIAGFGLCFIWHWFVNKDYGNLLFLVIGFVVSCPLLFARFFQKKAPNFYAIYWFLVLTYSLSFFSSYSLIENGFQQLWVMAGLVALMFSILLFRNFLIFLISIALGVGFALYFEGRIKMADLLKIRLGFNEICLLISSLLVVISAWLLKSAMIFGAIKNGRDELVQTLTSVLTHEIFNPLSNMKMVSNEIEQIAASSKGLEEDKKFQLLEVKNSVRNIAEIANGAIKIMIADLLEKPIYDSDFKVFSVQNSLLSIIEKYTYISKEERQKIKLLIDDNSDIRIRAVIERFEFIIFILLHNAINQEHQSKNFLISIGTEISYFDKKRFSKEISKGIIGKEWSGIFVNYSGNGIRPEILSKLFEGYSNNSKNFGYQSKKSNKRSEKAGDFNNGFGFGLDFCRKTMRLFGGEIICQSHFKPEGDGWTKFTLLFPRSNKNNSFKNSSRFFFKKIGDDLGSKSDNLNFLQSSVEDISLKTDIKNQGKENKIAEVKNLVTDNEFKEGEVVNKFKNQTQNSGSASHFQNQKSTRSNNLGFSSGDKSSATQKINKSGKDEQVAKFMERQNPAIESEFSFKNRQTQDSNHSHYILIVDDQEVNLRVMKAKIENNFPMILCDAAKSGSKAIEMVKDRKYDLIFMDIQMPEMTGIEAADKIKKFDQEVQIVALTSLGKYSFLKDDNKFANGANIAELFDGYLSKTAGDNFIMRTLGKWIPGLNDDFCYLGTRNENLEILRDKKILIADDQQMSRVITRRFLEQNGLKVVEAIDGQDMLTKYVASLNDSKKSSFDAIIADINMPILNGDEATIQIRKIELDNKVSFHDEVAIIALSGDNSKENIENFFRCGITDFFAKGSDPEILIKILANCFTMNTNQKNASHIKEFGKEVFVQENDSLGNDSFFNDSGKAEQKNNSEIFDSKNIRDLPDSQKSNNKKSFDDFLVLNRSLIDNFEDDDRKSLIKLFNESCEKMIAGVQSAIIDDNHKNLMFYIHSLKGLAANIGAERLLCYVRATEPIVKNDFALGNAWLKKYKLFYSQLQEELKKLI